MKYLLPLLSALWLLTSCSNANTPAAKNDTPQVAVSEAETSTDAETDATENTSQDSETQDNTQDTETTEDDIAGLNQKNVKLQVSNQRTFGQITIEKVATSRDGWVSHS